ncbi:adenosylhomocysteinase [Patescibacteria group bacterium]|nr:adenosylhomocysteinase [Patescibacteria group bacterium]
MNKNKQNNKTESWIADPSLAEEGQQLIEIARDDMPALVSLVKKYKETKPLKGSRISVCVIPTPETGNLIWALINLGAEVRLCSDNIISVDDRVAAAVDSWGVSVFGKRDQTLDEFFKCIQWALEFKDAEGNIVPPTQIIDDGSDMTQLIHRNKYKWAKELKGVSEQTTCGVEFAKTLKKQGKLKVPIIDINTGFKAAFDNYYGSKESFLYAFKRTKDIMFGGKKVLVSGYGRVGKGVVDMLKICGADVYVSEVSPVRAAHALMEGTTVVNVNDCLSDMDIFITAATTPHVFNLDQILKMKSGATLCNMGENLEYDAQQLVTIDGVEKVVINENLVRYKKGDWFIDSLCDGYLLNMRIGGNPPRVLGITFALHILAHIKLSKGWKLEAGNIYSLPPEVDDEIALMNFPELKDKLTELSNNQKNYLSGDTLREIEEACGCC